MTPRDSKRWLKESVTGTPDPASKFENKDTHLCWEVHSTSWQGSQQLLEQPSWINKTSRMRPGWLHGATGTWLQPDYPWQPHVTSVPLKIFPLLAYCTLTENPLHAGGISGKGEYTLSHLLRKQSNSNLDLHACWNQQRCQRTSRRWIGAEKQAT